MNFLFSIINALNPTGSSDEQDITAHLAKTGFDPVYGARPLKRTIQQYLENPLAEALLKGAFKSGETITVVLKDGELKFDAKKHKL